MRMEALDLLRLVPAFPAHLSTQKLLVLLLSALVAGLARGFSGFGGALIFMPLASAIVGPMLAAPLLLVIDSVAALGLIPNAWRLGDLREVGLMTFGALVGIPLGTSVLVVADAVTVRWIIIGIVTALLLVLLSGWRYRERPSAPLTVAVGATSGLFTGAAQTGGPPVVVYWLGGRDPVVIVRANIVLFFAASTALAGVSYLLGGLITPAVLVLALLAGPFYAVGLYVGSRLFGRATEAFFRRLCYGMIFAAIILGLPIMDGVLR
jgi:uncharacterized membrane protein YfcA